MAAYMVFWDDGKTSLMRMAAVKRLLENQVLSKHLVEVKAV